METVKIASMLFTKEELQLVLTALRCSGAISRESGHSKDADAFSELAKKVEDELWKD